MEFVTFEIAKKLKEKGFPQHWSDHHYILENEYEDDFFEVGAKYPVDVIYDYIPTIAAPTIYQVLDWFREEHHLHFEVVSNVFGYDLIISDTPDKNANEKYCSNDNDDGPNNFGAWNKYEDCVLYGIEYVLNNLI